MGNFEAEASVCVSPICCWPRFDCTSLAGHVRSVKNALVGRKNDAHEKVNTEP